MLTLDVPAAVRGLIFDCDGTLVDSMPLHWEAWHETFAAYSVSCPQSFLDALKGVPTVGIVARFNETFGHALPPEVFAAEKERIARVKLATVRPIEPVVDLARRYRGRLPMAVASGGDLETVRISLEAIGMSDHFDTYVTADDPVAPKPSPDIFLEAARRLGVDAPACLVYEDSDLGLEAAERAGMTGIDVRPFAPVTGQAG